MNRYQATIKISSGLQKVELEASSFYNARKMFEQLYGAANVMNVHQIR
jgi:hypothetical protein